MSLYGFDDLDDILSPPCLRWAWIFSPPALPEWTLRSWFQILLGQIERGGAGKGSGQKGENKKYFKMIKKTQNVIVHVFWPPHVSMDHFEPKNIFLAWRKRCGCTNFTWFKLAETSPKHEIVLGGQVFTSWLFIYPPSCLTIFRRVPLLSFPQSLSRS